MIPAMLMKSLQGAAGAANSLKGALTGLPDQIKGFVEAFSPAAVEQFNRALGDFMAVLGSALEPILAGFTELTRIVSDALLPVMEQLRPVFQQLVTDFVQRLIPVIHALAGIFVDLMPLVQMFADMMTALTPVLNAFTIIVGALARTLVQWVVSLFGDDTKEAMKAFQDSLKKMANQLLVFAGRVAALLGADGFLGNLISALEKKPKTGDSVGMKAAQSPAFKSFLEYGRDVALSASVAAGKSTEIKQEQFFKEALEHLKDIAKNPDKTKEEIIKAISDAAKAIVNALLSRAEGFKTGYDTGVNAGGNPLLAAGISYLFGPRGG